ncbi:MAG: RidA family protein [Deltaproteobacteria bacterium]|nr:RidA family protein [Deltaproteobacteria bacterium]
MKKTEIKNSMLPSLGFPWALHISDVTQWLFISGIPPMDKAGKVVNHGDAVAQFQYEMERMKEILTEAGMKLEDIMSLTITVTEKVDLYGEWGKFADAYLGYFPDTPGPAGGTLRMVRGLSHPKMLIEIEAIAAK